MPSLIRHFLTVLLAGVLSGGGVSALACTTQNCQVNAGCAAVHCTCCGESCCPLANPHQTPKPAALCRVQFPLLNAGKTAISGNTDSRTLMLAALNAQLILPITHVQFHSSSIQPNQPIARATLLSLGCALTV